MSFIKNKKSLMPIKFSIIFSMLYLPLISFAQVHIPDISDAVKSAQPPKFDKMEQKRPPNLDIVLEEQNPMLLKKGESIFVKDFYLESEEGVDISKANDILNNYKDKTLSMNDINDLSTKLSSLFKENGYMLARAYIPKQNVPKQDNVLVIKIVLGNYGDVSINNTSYVRDSFLQKTFESTLKKGKSVETKDVERAMLLAYKTPGATLPKVTVSPGEKFGESNFGFDVPASKRVEGYIIGDNLGAEPSGKYRVMGGMSLNSPFGIGDKLSIGGMWSEESAVKNGRVAYELPLSYDGVRLALSYSKTKTDTILSELAIDRASNPFEKIEGDSDIYNARISYPLILSQISTLDVYADYSYRETENKQDYGLGINDKIPKKSSAVRFGLDYGKFSNVEDINIYNNLISELTVGSLKRNDGIGKIYDDTLGTFYKLLLSYNGNITFNEKSSLLTNLTVQKALGKKSLDSYEQITLSGSNGVQVFTDSDFSADTGFVAQVEYQYKLPSIKNIKHKIGIFAEHARGVYENREFSPLSRENRSLSDAGIAYYVNFDGLFVNAKWAHVLGGGKAGEDVQKDTYRDRVMLTMGLIF